MTHRNRCRLRLSLDLFGKDYVDCDGNCLNDADGDDVCDEDEIAGCLDDTACNYNPAATDDDDSCVLPETGFDCSGNCLDGFILDESGNCVEDVTWCDDAEVTLNPSLSGESLKCGICPCRAV